MFGTATRQHLQTDTLGRKPETAGVPEDISYA